MSIVLTAGPSTTFYATRRVPRDAETLLPRVAVNARMAADPRWQDALRRPSQRALSRQEPPFLRQYAFGAEALSHPALKQRLYEIGKRRALLAESSGRLATSKALAPSEPPDLEAWDAEEREVLAELAALSEVPEGHAPQERRRTARVLDETNGPDAFESPTPNNSAANATTHANQATFTVPGYFPNLSIHDAADQDWFRLTVAQRAGLRIELTFSPGDGGSDLDLYIYKAIDQGGGVYAQGAQVGEAESGTPNESLSMPLDAGEYFIQVRGWSGSTNDYDMLVTLASTLPALELDSGDTTISASDARMAALLDSVQTVGGGEITHDRVGYDFPVGPTVVTWTIWDGAAGGTELTTFTDRVFVLPFGQTPLYVTTDYKGGQHPVQGAYATCANHGASLVRTGDGTLHCAWHDMGARKIWYLRTSAQHASDGTVTWDASSLQEIAQGSADDGAFVALAASQNAVHFAWEHGNKVRYRRMLKSGSAWNLGAEQICMDVSGKVDNGPDIAAFNDQEVHVAGIRNRRYAFCLDTGAGTPVWTRENLPLPAGASDTQKYPSVAVDSLGEVHMVWSQRITSNYWKLWYMHRKRPGAADVGVGYEAADWIESHNTLANFSAWDDRGAGNGDVIGDWIEITIDSADNIHLAFHGSGKTLIFEYDDAFYQFRPASGMGDPDAWTSPQHLHDGSDTLNLSYTPSIATLGEHGIAAPVYMYKALGLAPNTNYDDLDSGMRVAKDGVLQGSTPGTPLSEFASFGMATWWPCADPRLRVLASGTVFMDVLQAVKTSTAENRGIVVHQRVELTADIPPDKVTDPDPAHLATDIALDQDIGWSAAARAASYDVYFGADQNAVAAATTASPEFQGNQAGLSFEPGNLAVETTYYWRIDSKNAAGTTAGDVWRFTARDNLGPAIQSGPTATPNPTLLE